MLKKIVNKNFHFLFMSEFLIYFLKTRIDSFLTFIYTPHTPFYLCSLNQSTYSTSSSQYIRAKL